MSLGELSAQATMKSGSSSESNELSDNDFDPLSDPIGEALDNSLGGPDHLEQQMMSSFSSPHTSLSLGRTSTPNNNIKSGHEEAAGHQNIIDASKTASNATGSFGQPESSKRTA